MNTSLVILGAMAGVGFIILLAGFLISRRSERIIEERLGITEKAVEEVGERQRRSPLGDALNRALEQRGMGANLRTQLARADLKITVGEFMAATVILVIAAGGLMYIVKRDVIAAVGAALAGFFAPRFYLKFRYNRRLKAFNDMLGDTINLMVNGIRAGYSILQAMEAVSREMGPPISTEFARVVQEVQLGISLEDAMDNMLRRVPSDDLDMLITAINVQREVGGNLAEVLDTISFTIRERVRIKGEIKALTAQSRVSGYMVAMVPVVLAVIIYLINP
ncbi:MAG TPA: secretion system protein, partial [Anaerolineae bacterium]|nr:secretion system protein [Anaerolineae bacterium]